MKRIIMKRIIMTMVATFCILASAMSASAQEVKTTTLNNAMHGENLLINGAPGTLIKTDDGGYAFDVTGKSVASFGKIDGIIETDVKFNIKGSEWIGFTLRAVDEDKRSYSTQCYLAIVSANGIEIQRFSRTAPTGFLLKNNYKVPMNEIINVKTGVIPTEEGNYVFIKLGDVVFGVLDTEFGRAEEGYFLLDSDLSGITLYNTKHVDETIYQARLTYDPEKSKITADLGTNDEIKYNWYISDDNFTYIEREKSVNLTYFNLVSGVNEETFALKKEDLGRYVYCVAEVGGLKIYSNLIHIDEVQYVDAYLKGGVALRTQSSKAWVNGTTVRIDSSNPMVMPQIVDGRTLVPVRFITESFGGNVKWDAEARKVTIDIGGKTAELVIDNAELVIDGEVAETMDVPAQVIDDRTMVPLRILCETVLGKQVFWDNKGLIVISDIENILNSTADAETIDIILDMIK